MVVGSNDLLGNENVVAAGTVLTFCDAIFQAGRCLTGNNNFCMSQGRDFLLGDKNQSATVAMGSLCVADIGAVRLGSCVNDFIFI